MSECCEKTRRADIDVFVHAREIVQVKEHITAFRYMHEIFADLSRRVDADELLLADVPGELRDLARLYRWH
jgi:hypothetical protein